MASPSPLAGVIRLAAISRVLVLSLSLLSRLLFRPYDTSASLHPPCLLLLTPTSPNSTTVAAADPFSSLAVWDGVHFLRAAECGYEYEQSFAFLPLLPASLNLLARSLFAPLVPVLGYRAVLVISGYVLNNFAFVAAAAYFYRLSVLILKNPSAAYRASVLFCFNPASVFYSSLYSESLYALFSLGGIFYVFTGANTIAMIMLALSGSARSNGALNAGYFCFQALLHAYDAAFQKKSPMLAVQTLVTGFLRSVFIFLPFFAFQAYGYLNICLHGNTEELRPWCKAKGGWFLEVLSSEATAKLSFGFTVYSIMYYTKMLRQLIESISMHELIVATVEGRSIEENKSSDVDIVLKSEFSTDVTNRARGHADVKRRKSVATKTHSASMHNNRSNDRSFEVSKDGCPILVLPFILHLAFMTSTAFFVMHVQVSTRFLSASPPIYWAASHILVSPSCSKRWGYLICVYFIAYILLGSLLFSNFYPFT
uniref:GPI mannosyltransferase 2 n=1 Tax=Leersia perrieri TaxID=77586 RepID=A0A0D9XZJ2_9ORYZ